VCAALLVTGAAGHEWWSRGCECMCKQQSAAQCASPTVECVEVAPGQLVTGEEKLLSSDAAWAALPDCRAQVWRHRAKDLSFEHRRPAAAGLTSQSHQVASWPAGGQPLYFTCTRNTVCLP